MHRYSVTRVLHPGPDIDLPGMASPGPSLTVLCSHRRSCRYQWARKTTASRRDSSVFPRAVARSRYCRQLLFSRPSLATCQQRVPGTANGVLSWIARSAVEPACSAELSFSLCRCIVDVTVVRVKYSPKDDSTARGRMARLSGTLPMLIEGTPEGMTRAAVVAVLGVLVPCAHYVVSRAVNRATCRACTCCRVCYDVSLGCGCVSAVLWHRGGIIGGV